MCQKCSKAILVCGGRHWRNRASVFRVLDLIHAKHGIFVLISGGARGADKFAEEWSDARGVPKLIMRAKWAIHGNAAGPIRNRAMLRVGPDAVVAFPGGSGTADMVRIAIDECPIWMPFHDR